MGDEGSSQSCSADDEAAHERTHNPCRVHRCRVEGHGFGKILATDNLRQKCLTGRCVERRDRTAECHQDKKPGVGHVPRGDKKCPGEGQHDHARLGNDQNPASVEPVSQHTTKEAEQKQRYSTDDIQGTDQEC